MAFPTPWDSGDYGSGVTPYTLVELKLMGAMGAIKDKVGWLQKVHDAEIVKKWRTELSSSGLLESQVNFVIDELQNIAKSSDESCIPSPVDGVYQSDVSVHDPIRLALLKAVDAISNSQAIDYHPDSNNQVIDIVHPSLYCYVAGVSREVQVEGEPWQNFIGGGHVVARTIELVKPEKVGYYDNKPDYVSSSAKFQWIPSEVSVDNEGACKIESYINNAHPQQHAPFYRLCETILGQCMIPLWNAVLTEMLNPRKRRHVVDPYSFYEEPEFDEDADDYDEKYDDWYENRIPNVPQEVGAFEAPTPPQKVINLRGKKLQIITKVATIELAPGTSYAGGAWHVEGMRNEAIVASGIYYFQSENITESTLSFRSSVCEPEYDQGDDAGVAAAYGLQNDSALVQNIGSVSCVQGRAIAWPNTLQHKVQPFNLIDSKKPGLRKILVFFLVDPSKRIISTSIVPPQQLGWMQAEVKSGKPIDAQMPGDVQAMIAAQSWHFSHDDALRFRQELMEERKYFTLSNTSEKFEREFSLCEH